MRNFILKAFIVFTVSQYITCIALSTSVAEYETSPSFWVILSLIPAVFAIIAVGMLFIGKKASQKIA